jgi:hypothetical protein
MRMKRNLWVILSIFAGLGLSAGIAAAGQVTVLEVDSDTVRLVQNETTYGIEVKSIAGFDYLHLDVSKGGKTSYSGGLFDPGAEKFLKLEGENVQKSFEADGYPLLQFSIGDVAGSLATSVLVWDAKYAKEPQSPGRRDIRFHGLKFGSSSGDDVVVLEAGDNSFKITYGWEKYEFYTDNFLLQPVLRVKVSETNDRETFDGSLFEKETEPYVKVWGTNAIEKLQYKGFKTLPLSIDRLNLELGVDVSLLQSYGAGGPSNPTITYRKLELAGLTLIL